MQKEEAGKLICIITLKHSTESKITVRFDTNGETFSKDFEESLDQFEYTTHITEKKESETSGVSLEIKYLAKCVEHHSKTNSAFN